MFTSFPFADKIKEYGVKQNTISYKGEQLSYKGQDK